MMNKYTALDKVIHRISVKELIILRLIYDLQLTLYDLTDSKWGILCM